MSDYISELFGAGGLFASRVPGYQARPGQVALARTIDEALRDGRHLVGEAPCGCHVAGQEILMSDGSARLVEDVQVGDLLMGPGGEPRAVLELIRGQQETVEIKPRKGRPWRVNLDHVLTLVRVDTDEVVDVPVHEWLGWSKARKALHRLLRSAVAFAPRAEPLPLDAYVLGALLSDGTIGQEHSVGSGRPERSPPDADEPQGAERVAEPQTARQRLVPAGGGEAKGLLGIVRELGLLSCGRDDLFIPEPFKHASLDDRRALLAGLVDTGGESTACGRFYCFARSRRLAEDVVYVARSIGLAASFQSCRRRSQAGSTEAWYRICVGGDTHTIPCRIRQGGKPARRHRGRALYVRFDAARTGVVEPYFGFRLNADGRYLLGDFTVTHNSGKSLAYLAPAVRHAVSQGKRVIVATANIALQEQLIGKDLPMLRRVLPWPFTYALQKGRGNYACLDRVGESAAQGYLSALEDPDQPQIDDVLAWLERTTTGDVSELPFVPAPSVWSRFSVGSEECVGNGCRYRERCFAERARLEAQQADLVVTNFHMLFAHLALRQTTGEDLVLPPFDYVILDEAHEAADIAREFNGFRLSEYSVARLARYAERGGRERLATELRRHSADLFRAVAQIGASPKYKARLREPGFADPDQLVRALREVANVAASDEAGHLDPEDSARARSVRKHAETLASRLLESVQLADPNKVYFIDIDPKGRAKLGAKLISVADLLREQLFERTESVTLVSATMTTGGTFDFIRSEVGLPDDALELAVESPFDFKKQALLVLPDSLPDPRQPEFVDALADGVKAVIDSCGGRTLGLFTSYRNLDAVYSKVANNGHRVLKQGDLPRTELTRQFKEDVGSVLFGTDSFWTGIDVPGEALTAVAIDKLPFPNMNDPVIDAICERDEDAFNTHLVPRAIMKLRQGVGRLIRSQSDIGVVVIFDRRIIEKRYGKLFLASLPEMRRTPHLHNIRVFLERAANASPF